MKTRTFSRINQSLIMCHVLRPFKSILLILAVLTFYSNAEIIAQRKWELGMRAGLAQNPNLGATMQKRFKNDVVQADAFRFNKGFYIKRDIALPNKRIEFHPQISYSSIDMKYRRSQDIDGYGIQQIRISEQNRLHFFFISGDIIYKFNTQNRISWFAGVRGGIGKVLIEEFRSSSRIKTYLEAEPREYEFKLRSVKKRGFYNYFGSSLQAALELGCQFSLGNNLMRVYLVPEIISTHEIEKLYLLNLGIGYRF
jgi:hypothetical protein